MNDFIPVSFKKIPMIYSLAPMNIYEEKNIVRVINYAVTPNEKIPRQTFAYEPKDVFENHLDIRQFTYLIVHNSNLFIDGNALLVMTQSNKTIAGRAYIKNPNEIFIGNCEQTKGCLLAISQLRFIGRILSAVTEMQ